jgi:hypothetical protein
MSLRMKQQRHFTGIRLRGGGVSEKQGFRLQLLWFLVFCKQPSLPWQRKQQGNLTRILVKGQGVSTKQDTY